jgi:Gpi18-like mannosyltransferase
VIGNDLAAALFISNIALSATLAVLYLYVTEKFDESVARRTLICLIVFPTAFFFFGAYTEGLFLLTALLSMIAIEREHWLWAGVAIFCAVLFRLQGIALFAPLAYSLWTTRSRGANIARVVGGAIALLALALYLLMRYALGEITVVPISDPSWHARLVSPWQSYFYALQTIASGKFLFADVLNLIVTTLCIFILIVGWKRLPMNWLLYAAASLIVLTMQYLETMPLKSMSRYALTLFPVFVLVGVWGRSGWRQRVIIYSCLVLFLFLTAQFVLWGWVA